MKSNFKSLGKVKYEYFGKTVYVTFQDDVNGKVFSRFYRSEAIAKAQVTKFENRLAKQVLELH